MSVLSARSATSFRMSNSRVTGTAFSRWKVAFSRSTSIRDMLRSRLFLPLTTATSPGKRWTVLTSSAFTLFPCSTDLWIPFGPFVISSRNGGHRTTNWNKKASEYKQFYRFAPGLSFYPLFFYVKLFYLFSFVLFHIFKYCLFNTLQRVNHIDFLHGIMGHEIHNSRKG